jgi:RNA polymerase sigma-70 factor, ECF subfamily
LQSPPFDTLAQDLVLYGLDDTEAFNRLYLQIAPGIEHYLKRRLHHEEQVSDAFQQVFLKLHQYRHRYDIKYLPWQWIYVIARSQVIISSKKARLDSRHQEYDDSLSQNEDIEANNIQSDQLHSSLSLVDEATREILMDKFMDQQSYDEIALRLGVKPASLRQKVSRALKFLRLQQHDKGDNDES